MPGFTKLPSTPSLLDVLRRITRTPSRTDSRARSPNSATKSSSSLLAWPIQPALRLAASWKKAGPARNGPRSTRSRMASSHSSWVSRDTRLLVHLQLGGELRTPSSPLPRFSRSTMSRTMRRPWPSDDASDNSKLNRSLWWTSTPILTQRRRPNTGWAAQPQAERGLPQQLLGELLPSSVLEVEEHVAAAYERNAEVQGRLAWFGSKAMPTRDTRHRLKARMGTNGYNGAL